MSFLLKWLGFGRPAPQIGLRPHREVMLASAYDTAFERVIDAMTSVLGANVYIADRDERCIEAGFGLVNSERIRCTFESAGALQTTARIEALFPAGSIVPKTSRAVDALAEFLARCPTGS